MRRVATVVPIAVALGLAACGGDEDKGPSKAEFIQKADAICAKSDREGEAIAKRSFEDPEKPKPEEAQAALREAVPATKRDLDELKELERPEGDEQTIEEFFAAIEKGITTLEVSSEDPELALEALVAGDPFAEANELAQEYGMKACAR